MYQHGARVKPEGKIYLCAIKDVFSNRIVGYSISDRMTSQIAVNALVSAVRRRRDVAGCVVHSDRGSQFRSRKVAHVLAHHDLVGSMGQVASAGDNAAMESFFSLLQRNVRTGVVGPPARTCASRSSTGSKGPTTAADANKGSGA